VIQVQRTLQAVNVSPVAGKSEDQGVAKCAIMYGKERPAGRRVEPV
jgi:hypothetical protein